MSSPSSSFPWFLACLVVLMGGTTAFQSRWTELIKASQKETSPYLVFPNFMYQSSNVVVQVICAHEGIGDAVVYMDWVLEEVTCMEDLRVGVQREDAPWFEDDSDSQLNTDDNMKTNINSANAEVNAINAGISDNNADPTSVNDNISGVGAGLSSINTGASSVTDDIKAIDAGLGSINNGGDGVNDDVRAIDAGLSSIHNGASGVNGDIKAIDAGLASINNGGDGVDHDVSAVDNGLSKVTSGVSDVNDEISGIGDGSTDVKNDVNSISDDASDINAGTSSSVNPDSNGDNTSDAADADDDGGDDDGDDDDDSLSAPDDFKTPDGSRRRVKRDQSGAPKKVKLQKFVSAPLLCQQSNIMVLPDKSRSPYIIVYVPGDFKRGSGQHLATSVINRTDLEQEEEVGPRVVQPWETGMYHFYFRIRSVTEHNVSVRVTVGMHGKYGYLSAIDWPLLPANGAMAFLYLTTATVWVLVWARSHRHSSKIHVIIGTVATAGALSHTLQFVENATINSSGEGVAAILWFALVVSVFQTSALDFLLMVVSTGYGITRPVLPRSLLTGIVTLCSAQFVASLGYEICVDKDLQLQYRFPMLMKTFLWLQTAIKVIIAGWVLVAAVSTFIHLIGRKHSTKLRVFSIFTGTCVIALLAHLAIFGLSISWIRHCRTDWQNEWLFSAFGSIVSFILLIVLMWLWRPADVHQSYAFSPLASMDDEDELELDDEDDDDDDDGGETEKFKLEPL